MGKVIGIDLGTTFSAAAYIDEDGKPQMIPNYEGDMLTPSAVLFDGDTRTVGKEAKRESVTDAEHFVGFVKREMGNQSKKYTIDGLSFKPEEISATILKKIRNDAELALDDQVTGAVITVPAYFTDAQRSATMAAANIANIPVLAIINEPTAAALSYGIGKGDEKEKKILVYDLGGGTFDISVMKFEGDKIETLSSMGNRALGGYDFDLKIVNWFEDMASANGFSFKGDPDAEQDLLMRAEEAKKALSTGRPKSKITVVSKGKKFSCELTKEIFERLIESEIYTTISLMNAAMQEAGLEYSNLDKILLVGGSTRIPLVAQMIEEETEIVPSHDIHPDQAVAIGAAWHALAEARKQSSKKDRTGSATEYSGGTYERSPAGSNNTVPKVDPQDLPNIPVSYTFTDRTSHGIGVVIENELGEEINSVILPKNSVIPAEAQQDYVTTVDYQECILLKVTEGEYSELKVTTIIGEAELRIRPKPKGTPVRVTIACDSNSIIHVHVMDMQEQEDLGEMRIERTSNMNEQEIEAAKNRLGKLYIG